LKASIAALASPPCHIGPRSTPNYPALADSTIATVGDGVKVFAGQRLDGFYVDLGAVFDLAVLRPFQNLHLIPTPAGEPAWTVRFCQNHWPLGVKSIRAWTDIQ